MNVLCPLITEDISVLSKKRKGNQDEATVLEPDLNVEVVTLVEVRLRRNFIISDPQMDLVSASSFHHPTTKVRIMIRMSTNH